MQDFSVMVVSRKIGDVNSRMQAREFLVEAPDGRWASLASAWDNAYAMAWERLHLTRAKLLEPTK